MSRIDKSTFLQNIMRQEVLKKHSQNKTNQTTHQKTDRSPNQTETFQTPNIEQRIISGLAAIDQSKSNAPQKVIEVYVNAALLDTFGAKLQNDPNYAHLLADVLEALTESPDYSDFIEFAQTELQHVK